MPQSRPTIAVLGAGAWGTALAVSAARAGTPASLWGRRVKEGEPYSPAFPTHKLPPSLGLVSDLKAACRADMIVLAVPAQALRELLGTIKPHLHAGALLVNTAKGIEQKTLCFPSEIIADVLGGRAQAMLSGPSFASEVMENRPTLITIAGEDEKRTAEFAQALHSVNFRPYASRDLRGVEIGGAAKNVLAIACGVAAGFAPGENAKAALIARAFAELVRFGLAEGARPETLSGLSGLGDLILTCSGDKSRNYSLGKAIAEAGDMRSLDWGRLPLAEGAKTAPAMLKRAMAKGVDMPIAESVVALLGGKVSLPDLVAALLERPLRREN